MLSVGLVGSATSRAQMGAGRPPQPTGGAPNSGSSLNPTPPPGPVAVPMPPFDLKDDKVIQEGSILFATSCTYCHQRLQKPAVTEAAPTLRDKPYDKEYLFKMISEGPPSRRMPAWKHQYSTEQIWKLVAYILSLKGTEGQ